eukprot:1158000-Pelagomonas_calceolata.AAC.2
MEFIKTNAGHSVSSRRQQMILEDNPNSNFRDICLLNTNTGFNLTSEAIVGLSVCLLAAQLKGVPPSWDQGQTRSN